jgi:hypothetical protein
MGQSVELGEPREGKQSMLDRLGVLALVLFNVDLPPESWTALGWKILV